MAQAGFCSACDSNVWLTDAGECSAGHPASCISGVYQAEPATSIQGELQAPQQPNKTRGRGLVAGLLIALVVLLVACGVIASLVVPRLARQGSGIASEWKSRLAKDYPGWKAVGFNARSFQGSGESETTYEFTMVPPDGRYSYPILYVAKNGGPPASQDEIFRPAGKFHDRAGSLMEYVNRNYYAKDVSTSAITSDSDGGVTVEWIKVRSFGPFSSRYGSYDDLTYDETAGQWTATKH